MDTELAAPVPHAAASPSGAGVRTPAFIKRNTIWLALSQMFVGAGVNLTFALGPLMILGLLGSSTLSGLSVSLHGLSRFLAAYPFGRITDRYGRKPGLQLGLFVALLGAVAIGVAMNARSFPGLILGFLIFGIGSNGVQQMRLAAAEMYPPERRAVVIGYVLSGALVGVVASPALVGLSGALAPVLQMDPLALPWLIVPALIVPSMVMISRVRPDPKEIAATLHLYYPDYVAPATAAEPIPAAQGFGLREFMADPQRRLAAVAMFSAQGSMQVGMVTAPLILAHHGAGLPVVALSLSIHAAGMFAPSVPIGKLADRFGRRVVLVAGTAVEAVGGVIAALTTDEVSVTAGIFLVGVGWCAANVASTAIVIDSTPAPFRGRSIGMIDSLAAIAGLAVPIFVGPLIELAGPGATAVLAVALMVPPSVLLLQPGTLRAASEPT